MIRLICMSSGSALNNVAIIDYVAGHCIKDNAVIDFKLSEDKSEQYSKRHYLGSTATFKPPNCNISDTLWYPFLHTLVAVSISIMPMRPPRLTNSYKLYRYLKHTLARSNYCCDGICCKAR